MALQSLFNHIFCLLLSLCLALPTSIKNFKYILIFLLLVLSFFLLKQFKTKITQQVYAPFAITSFLSLIACTLGYINGNSGFASSMPLYLIYPMLFALFFIILDDWKKLHLYFCYTTLVIFISSLVFIKTQDTNSLFVSLFPIKIINYFDGFTEYNLPNITSLMFLYPYFFSRLFILKYKSSTFWINAILLIMVTFITIQTGRRSLIFLIPIFSIGSLFFIFHLKKFDYLKKLILSLFFILICIPATHLTNPIKIDPFIHMLLHGFNGEALSMFPDVQSQNIDPNNLCDENNIELLKNKSMGVKKIQMIQLLNAWKERPILGYGVGASLKNCVRSYEMPWSYEMTYFALLFQLGLLVLATFALIYLWSLFKLYLMTRNSQEAQLIFWPFIFGSFGILIATYVNPYLLKFSYIWIIFLPIAMMNYLSTMSNKSSV